MNIILLIRVIFNGNMMKKKIQLEFNAYEMDLILKSLWLGYSNVENEKLLFRNKDNDKDKLFYLHRLLS